MEAIILKEESLKYILKVIQVNSEKDLSSFIFDIGIDKDEIISLLSELEKLEYIYVPEGRDVIIQTYAGPEVDPDIKLTYSGEKFLDDKQADYKSILKLIKDNRLQDDSLSYLTRYDFSNDLRALQHEGVIETSNGKSIIAYFGDDGLIIHPSIFITVSGQRMLGDIMDKERGTNYNFNGGNINFSNNNSGTINQNQNNLNQINSQAEMYEYVQDEMGKRDIRTLIELLEEIQRGEDKNTLLDRFNGFLQKYAPIGNLLTTSAGFIHNNLPQIIEKISTFL